MSDSSQIGLVWDNCGGVLKQKAQRMGWALCIGAGSSRDVNGDGVFPDWPALVKLLLKEDSVVRDADRLWKSLAGNFSPDALIEAAKDRLSFSHDQFVERLQSLLYFNLRSKVERDKWDEMAKCLTAASPAQRTREEWERFRGFFLTEYKDLCAIQLARVISATNGKGLEPAAIVSFNAEPLLYALINAERALSQNKRKPPKQVRMFNRVSRGISYQEAGRFPYIFCHGLLEVESGYKIFSTAAAASEKLVFSEASYLQLANSSFSWQSAMFLGTAVLRSMVFVGTSFTDPNLRRWLASVHANRVGELKAKMKNHNPTYEHYWLNRAPKNEAEKRWMESLVRHLGVRLVWMNDFDDFEPYLRKMLGLG